MQCLLKGIFKQHIRILQKGELRFGGSNKILVPRICIIVFTCEKLLRWIALNLQLSY